MLATKGNEWVGATDEERDWLEDWGWLGRLRWIAAVSGLDLVTVAGAARKVGWAGSAVAGTVLTLLVILLAVFRKLRKNVLRIRIRFHELCHWFRDESRTIQMAAQSGKLEKYSTLVELFPGGAADRVANYFRALCNDETVNCAIRVCMADPSASSGFVYVTVGRSSQMSTQRKAISVPLPSDQGIAKKLREENQLGVGIVRSIDRAAAEGWWKPCPTDKLPDVTSCMVAPINTPTENGGRSMLGILYVTSKHDTFRRRHVEPMKGVADLLGMTYLSIALGLTDGTQAGGVTR
jgi:hypothetical protein